MNVQCCLKLIATYLNVIGHLRQCYMLPLPQITTTITVIRCLQEWESNL